jgi:hypothetical protein
MTFKDHGTPSVRRQRRLFVTVLGFIASVAVGAATSFATPLVSFTDLGANGALRGPLTAGLHDWDVQWTQSVPTTNVTVRAVLNSNGPPVAADWWITTAIGPGTTVADVVASGTYTAPQVPSFSDFNLIPRTTLATGLNFAAGSYYLVFAGPPGHPNQVFMDGVFWEGGSTVSGPLADIAVHLAPGFSIGDYGLASPPAAFGPASTFSACCVPVGGFLAFELESFPETSEPVPEPSTMMMLGAGLCLSLGRRRLRP